MPDDKINTCASPIYYNYQVKDSAHSHVQITKRESLKDDNIEQ